MNSLLLGIITYYGSKEIQKFDMMSVSEITNGRNAEAKQI